MPLVCILGIQSGYAIAQAQPIEAPEAVPVPPSVTQVLPANVTGVMLFNNQPQPWQNASRFLPIPSDFAPPGFVPHLPPEINFTTEIKPWLGDWTAQVLMPNSQSIASQSSADSRAESPVSHRTLTLAPVTDASRLPQFIEQVKQQRSTPPIEQEYQGVKILVWPETVISPEETMPPLPTESSESKSPGQIFPLTLPPERNSGNKVGTMLSQWPSLEKLLKSQSQSILGQGLAPQTGRQNLPIAPWMASQGNSLPEPMPPQVVPGLAIAVVPGYLAAAPSPEAIKQWLDSRDQGMKLAENPNFQRTLENPDFNRSLFVGYGDISGLAQSFWEQSFDPTGLPFPVPIPNIPDLQNTLGLLGENYSNAEVLAWFQPEGIRVQYRLYYQNPIATTEINSVGDDIYGQIPAATYFSLSGNNLNQLNQLFLGLFRGLLNQPAIAEVWSTLSNTRNSAAPNIEPSSIPWLDGEYAIFLFPSTGGLFPAFDPRLQLALGIILETKDPAAAQTALQQLDQLVVRSSQQNVTLNQDILNGQTVTEWQVFNPQRQAMESLFSYTWLNQQTLLIATGLTPLKELHPKPYLSLDRAFNFTTATSPLPRPNHGYLYLNIGSLLSLVNNFLDPQQINNDMLLNLGTSILANIRSITFSTSSTNISTQSDIFMVLSPRRRVP
jgi:hypothetical protein